jgi:hypothetical protein
VRAPERRDPGHPWHWEDVENGRATPPEQLAVDVTENPVVAVIYGPKGQPIRQMRERAVVPFGFQPRAKS